MTTFGINNAQTTALYERDRGFGSVQAMHAKQEEADKKISAEQNPQKGDSVTISDQARLIINSSLNKVVDSGNLANAAETSALVKQVRKAEEAMERKVVEQTEEENPSGSISGANGKTAAESAPGGGAFQISSEGETEQDPKAAMRETLEKQIEAKQKELQELMGDDSEESQAKISLIQAELSMLENELNELNEE